MNISTTHTSYWATRLFALTLTLSVTAHSFGETVLKKVGEPVFIPHFAATSASWQYSSNSTVRESETRKVTEQVVGDSYFVGPTNWNRRTGLLPGAQHDGPYDLRLRELLAAYGGINTDVFLAEELRGSEIQFGFHTLVPIDGAINGASPDNFDGPIIPNDIFPITVTRKKFTQNGTTIIGRDSWKIQSLEDLGDVTNIDGDAYEFDGLHRSHVVLPHKFGAGWNHSLDSMVGNFEHHHSFIDKNGDGWETIDKFRLVRRATDVTGDLNYSGQLDGHDYNILTRNVEVAPAEPHGDLLARLDLNGESLVDVSDLTYWDEELLQLADGDANRDGLVNATDLNALAVNWRTVGGATWEQGDFTGDGNVGAADLNALALNWNRGVTAAASYPAAVPEPSSIMLLLLGACTLVRRAVG